VKFGLCALIILTHSAIVTCCRTFKITGRYFGVAMIT
jgi:hypothetical protein